MNMKQGGASVLLGVEFFIHPYTEADDALPNDVGGFFPATDTRFTAARFLWQPDDDITGHNQSLLMRHVHRFGSHQPQS